MKVRLAGYKLSFDLKLHEMLFLSFIPLIIFVFSTFFYMVLTLDRDWHPQKTTLSGRIYFKK